MAIIQTNQNLLPAFWRDFMSKIRTIGLLLVVLAVLIAFPVTASDYFAPVPEKSAPSIMQNNTITEAVHRMQQEKKLALLNSGNSSRRVLLTEIIGLQTWETLTVAENSPIQYEIQENHTSNMWYGDAVVRQAGVLGEHTVNMVVSILGGTEFAREVVSENIISPIEKIVDIGTANLGDLADVTAEDFHYFKHITMEATAYTANYSCTGKKPDDPWFGITASGRRVEHGIVAIDRSIIPFGTRLYVEGYGFAIAADVGGAIRGNRIDLYMYSIEDALRFGRRQVSVWILDEI